MMQPVVLSARSDSDIPAMACVREFEAVIVEALDARIVPIADAEKDAAIRAPATFIVALSFPQLVQTLRRLRGKHPAGGPVVAFVFDGFPSARLERVPPAFRRFTSYWRELRRLDAIFSPVVAINDQLSSLFGSPISTCDIGVDALGHGSREPQARWVSVNGYGRQPEPITAALSRRFNIRGANGFFFHTDHMRLASLTHVAQHRAMFWQMLRSSQLALAYAPEYYDPGNRFPASFVGQRWFESLAAGCVVIGKRPQAAETTRLLDWDDATIELPENPDGAVAAIDALLADPERLRGQSAENARYTLQRHDWRIRLAAITKQAVPALADRAQAAAAQCLDAA